jgi:hypothetical protein
MCQYQNGQSVHIKTTNGTCLDCGFSHIHIDCDAIFEGHYNDLDLFLLNKNYPCLSCSGIIKHYGEVCGDLGEGFYFIKQELEYSSNSKDNKYENTNETY